MILIPNKQVEAAIADASKVARKTGKTQFVRAIGFDLYASLGFTDDPDLQIGTLFATVQPAGTVTRHVKPQSIRCCPDYQI